MNRIDSKIKFVGLHAHSVATLLDIHRIIWTLHMKTGVTLWH